MDKLAGSIMGDARPQTYPRQKKIQASLDKTLALLAATRAASAELMGAKWRFCE
jgi:hypothetical protein